MNDKTGPAPLTLWHLLVKDGTSPRMNEAVFASSQKFEEMWKSLDGLHAAIKKDGMGKTVLDAMDSILEQPLADVFAAAWKTCSAIWEYGDTDKYPPDETNMVPFGQHTLTHSYDLEVEIKLGGKEIGSIPFSLELGMILRGAVLTISGGRIHKITPASCAGGGKLSTQDVVLLEQETHDLPLLGVMVFPEGIPIRPGVAQSP
jgi:hypothetical protein